MAIVVIHHKHHNHVPGSRLYVGRGGQWGNPFASKPSRVGKQISLAEWQAKSDPWLWLVQHKGRYTVRVSSSQEAVDLYRQLLRQMWQHDPFMRHELLTLAGYYKQQADDLLLVCWCKHQPNDDTPCHGDVIKGAIEGIIARDLV